MIETSSRPLGKWLVKIENALSKTLQETTEKEGSQTIDISSAQYIIFSDHHKGGRNRADDFLIAEKTYHAALAYYFYMGHTLITLGDVEELWEEGLETVLKAYEYTLKLEAQFHCDGRYWRVWGNHDDDWRNPDLVRQYLDPIYGGPPLKVREAVRLTVMDGKQELGTLFLTHGHQGTATSDRFASISKPLVRYGWRALQNLTGRSMNTPAEDWELRDQHNIAMYKWAARQEKLALVVGHTHRPVFRSRLHSAKIRDELEKSKAALMAKPKNTRLRKEVSALAAELEWVLAQENQKPGPEGQHRMEKPCYFNTGCCSFLDGDITGIEIVDGEIRLIRWPDDEGSPKPKVLEQASLKTLFAEL